MDYQSQIISGSPVPTFVIDHNHCITHWNRACESLTGLPAKDLIGTSLQWKAFYGEKRSVLADMIVEDGSEDVILSLYEGSGQRSLLIDGAYEADGYFPDLGEEGKWLFFTAAPLRDDSGRIVGAVETLQDITGDKKAGEKEHKLNLELAQKVIELQASFDLLRETQHELIQAGKMAALGSLVASVAHEINTPVGIGVTAASLLEEKTRDCANLLAQKQMKLSDLEAYFRVATESSEMILSNLKRASELIQSFKQVAVDQTTEALGTFRLRECLDNILMSLRPKLRKSSHSVQVQCREDILLQSYAGALSQVISNLVSNSLMHGLEGMENGFISIEAQENRGYVNITYRDNGKGIPDENLDRIFEPFFTTKRNKGGTGLGLHIIYNLINKTLRGQIECASPPGQGAVFRITIPKEINDFGKQ